MDPPLNAPPPPASCLDFQKEDHAEDSDPQQGDQEQGERDARAVLVTSAVRGIVAIATAPRSDVRTTIATCAIATIAVAVATVGGTIPTP